MLRTRSHRRLLRNRRRTRLDCAENRYSSRPDTSGRSSSSRSRRRCRTGSHLHNRRTCRRRSRSRFRCRCARHRYRSARHRSAVRQRKRCSRNQRRVCTRDRPHKAHRFRRNRCPTRRRSPARLHTLPAHTDSSMPISAGIRDYRSPPVRDSCRRLNTVGNCPHSRHLFHRHSCGYPCTGDRRTPDLCKTLFRTGRPRCTRSRWGTTRTRRCRSLRPPPRHWRRRRRTRALGTSPRHKLGWRSRRRSDTPRHPDRAHNRHRSLGPSLCHRSRRCRNRPPGIRSRKRHSHSPRRPRKASRAHTADTRCRHSRRLFHPRLISGCHTGRPFQ